jgi:hypothetical protein
MAAFLPPISSDTGREPLAAAFMIDSPVRVSPVKVSASTQRMRGQELAGRVRSEAMDDVVDALGNANLVHHFAEQRGGARRIFRRLDDHGVAAGQRRAYFPGHQQQRQIPRTDDAD